MKIPFLHMIFVQTRGHAVISILSAINIYASRNDGKRELTKRENQRICHWIFEAPFFPSRREREREEKNPFAWKKIISRDVKWQWTGPGFRALLFIARDGKLIRIAGKRLTSIDRAFFVAARLNELRGRVVNTIRIKFRWWKFVSAGFRGK